VRSSTVRVHTSRPFFWKRAGTLRHPPIDLAYRYLAWSQTVALRFGPLQNDPVVALTVTKQ
jgi:hypothetical protein